MNEGSFVAGFNVGDLSYVLQFLRLSYLDGHDLSGSRTYDVSFRLDSYVAPDGEVKAGYRITGTGHCTISGRDPAARQFCRRLKEAAADLHVGDLHEP